MLNIHHAFPGRLSMTLWCHPRAVFPLPTTLAILGVTNKWHMHGGRINTKPQDGSNGVWQKFAHLRSQATQFVAPNRASRCGTIVGRIFHTNGPGLQPIEMARRQHQQTCRNVPLVVSTHEPKCIIQADFFLRFYDKRSCLPEAVPLTTVASKYWFSKSPPRLPGGTCLTHGTRNMRALTKETDHKYQKMKIQQFAPGAMLCNRQHRAKIDSWTDRPLQTYVCALGSRRKITTDFLKATHTEPSSPSPFDITSIIQTSFGSPLKTIPHLMHTRTFASARPLLLSPPPYGFAIQIKPP